MSFSRYPEYKDSGVQWLGEVPKHWSIRRLKHVLAQVTDRANRRSNPIALENIEGWSGRYVETESDFSGGGVAFRAGDILFGKLRPYLAKVYLSESPGEALGDFHVMRACVALEPKFAFHQLLQRQFISVVDGATHGAKMPRVGWEVMGNMPFVIPPSSEQQTIATYLEHETARIDGLIEEQKRLIELFKEKRQVVISHAVTKGLDRDVTMKDSGVEWLGEVPTHWAVTKVAYHYEVVLGKMLDERRITGKHLAPYLRNTDVQWDQINLERLPLMDFSPADRKKYELKEGDLLVCEGGEVGRAAIWDGQKAECYYQKALHRMRPLRKDLEVPRFMFYLLWHASEQGRFTSMEGKSTIAHLPAETLRQYQFPFPPKGEQENIVFYLDRINSEMDKLVEEAEHSIHLLRERRSALISAAVTGRIDVRDWQQSAGESVPAEGTQKVTA